MTPAQMIMGFWVLSVLVLVTIAVIRGRKTVRLKNNGKNNK